MHLRKLQHNIIPFQRDYEQLVNLSDLLQWYYPKSQHCFYGLAFLRQAQQGQGQRSWRKHFPKPLTGCLTLDDPFTMNNVYKLCTQMSTEKTKLHATELEMAVFRNHIKE